jgi:hypothetical protein
MMRPDWVPSRPGASVLTRRDRSLLPRCLPLHSGQPCSARYRIPPAVSTMTRQHRGLLTFTRPVFSSPVVPGWNKDPAA